MKYYAQFYKRNAVGVLDIAPGSDSVFILDGRTTRTHMVDTARRRAYQLRFVQPRYEAFKIMCSGRFENDGDPKHLHSILFNL